MKPFLADWLNLIRESPPTPHGDLQRQARENTFAFGPPTLDEAKETTVLELKEFLECAYSEFAGRMKAASGPSFFFAWHAFQTGKLCIGAIGGENAFTMFQPPARFLGEPDTMLQDFLYSNRREWNAAESLEDDRDGLPLAVYMRRIV